MSTFVSVASYCDPLLGFTIARARDAARRPDEIHFGIVDQCETPLAEPPANYLRIAPADARGPCWARTLAMSFYRGEDWFLQIDSHMDFDPGWDERLIDQARALAHGRRGVALTCYPSAFVFEDGKPVHKPLTTQVLACALRKESSFRSGPVLAFESHVVEVDRPWPAIHLGAGCLFADGRFALEFPYDPNLYFHGEEQALFLRLFTHGWDVFHPPGMPIYHLYNNAQAGIAPRPMHWDPGHEALRAVKWQEREQVSQNRFADLVAGKLLGVYGLGSVRSLADYAAFSGIDYARRAIEPRAYLPPGTVQRSNVEARPGLTGFAKTRWV